LTVVYFKFFKWLSVGVGYRQMLTTDDIIRKNLNGPIYIIKIKIFLSDVFKIAKEKKKKIKKAKIKKMKKEI
jgi:hypothetical protein